MQDLEGRIAALERELAAERERSRRFRAGAVLAVCLLGLVAASEPLKVLRASRVEVGPSETPSVVLGDGVRGPSIELRDADGNTATLTARGLSFAEPEPVETPTLEQPGLAAAAPPPTARVFVKGMASAVEVTCSDLGYRQRTSVVSHVAVVEVPEAASCSAFVKGAENLGRFTIQAGVDYVCFAGRTPPCRPRGPLDD
ncbi:MAG: hypothetical protein H6736_22805 [Alphaproteobacteria bacterium]|nr:hypothetical protein [Alphaproteobacteria bacterium]